MALTTAYAQSHVKMKKTGFVFNLNYLQNGRLYIITNWLFYIIIVNDLYHFQYPCFNSLFGCQVLADNSSAQVEYGSVNGSHTHIEINKTRYFV